MVNQINQIKQTIGWIGCGNMARAMIAGLVRSGLVEPKQIIASNPSLPALEKVEKQYGIQVTQSNVEAAQKSDILFLAVKPYLYETIIEEIRAATKPDAIIVMIAAGQSIAKNEARFGRPIKLVKSMPNTPAMVGEGMSALCPNELLSQNEIDIIKAIFDSFGKSEFVKEEQMDVVAGVSGSSPAYAYLFIEALADGAVLEGMPRKQAYVFAAQAVLGAAKMVLETGEHPGALKDAVCSPGGTTIEAVAALEEGKLRSTVIQAVKACTEKSRKMAD